MAEEQMHEQAPSFVPAYDLDNPDIKTTYSNYSTIWLGNTEVALYFGEEKPAKDGVKIDFSHRIVITHHQFLRMMEAWATRYDLIQSLYAGYPMSLRQLEELDPERAKKAWENLQGILQPQEPQNNEQDTQSDSAI